MTYRSDQDRSDHAQGFIDGMTTVWKDGFALGWNHEYDGNEEYGEGFNAGSDARRAHLGPAADDTVPVFSSPQSHQYMSPPCTPHTAAPNSPVVTRAIDALTALTDAVSCALELVHNGGTWEGTIMTVADDNGLDRHALDIACRAQLIDEGLPVVDAHGPVQEYGPGDWG